MKILVIDDEVEYASTLSAVLQKAGHEALGIHNPQQAQDILETHSFDAAICDVRMPQLGGMELLRQLRSIHPHLSIVMMSGYPTVENAVRAMKLGAITFLSKPIQPKQLLAELESVVAEQKKTTMPPSNNQPKTLITGHRAMKQLLSQIDSIATTDAPVLITGESGTGKELIAERLHFGSSRAKGPCIRVNCAALPEGLLDSELFGAEKGAYTDSHQRRLGKFEAAHGGTLFLDEIGDMSLTTQAKILRALQCREIMRVGGHESIAVDIRVIAATNQDLVKMIQEGSFREDLYYRLSVLTFHLPPLRSRQGDIPLLAQHFLSEFSHSHGKTIHGIHEEALNQLSTHDWPGNIRELKNCIERAVLFCHGPEIQPAHLPTSYQNTVFPVNQTSSLETINRHRILDALKKTGGAKAKAAALLEIDRRTLYNRMKRLGIS
ncbi:MAG: sigma-54 dependent transcriptional regulator [Spirochaetales bacterium]|nr:sigma-54 dependent transcriptional regulator [Spirochaetales bacterium]